MMRRSAALLGLLAILLVVGVTPATTTAAAPKPQPQTTLPDMEDVVMCPTCGTLLNLSHSPAAERERVFIRRLIAKGKTKSQIEDALVVEYGPGVLALPRDEGFNVVAYVVPLLIFVLGGAGVIYAIFRWRRNRDDEDGPDGIDPDSGPRGDDAKKLEEDLARFDL